MNRAGDQLLARSALAGHEHRRFGLRDPLDGPEDRPHRFASTDHLPELLAVLDFVAQALDLVLELPLLELVANLELQRFELEGLRHEVGGPALHRLDRRIHGVGRGQHDHRRAYVAFGQLDEQVEATAAGHHEVEQHDVRCREGDLPERIVDAPGDAHVALGFQQHAQGFLHTRLVVDYQNARHSRSLPRLLPDPSGCARKARDRAQAGVRRSTSTRVSCASLASTVSCPPLASTIVSASTYSSTLAVVATSATPLVSPAPSSGAPRPFGS